MRYINVEIQRSSSVLIMIFPKNSLVSKNPFFLLNLLQAINTSSQTFKHFLKQANDNEIETLIEIIRNFLVGSQVFNSPVYINRMKKYRRLIRDLASKQLSTRAKRRKIVSNQQGGALLTSLLIPIVGTLLSNVISKHIK